MGIKDQGFGYGQTPQNVTGARALGTSYTNNSGKPIAVAVQMSNGTAGTATLTIAGVTIYGESYSTGSVISVSVSGIVPVGATYSANHTAAAPTLNSWVETR